MLAIVAYREPIMRIDIEAIRGVQCAYTLRNLLLRGLIERRDQKSHRGYVYTLSFAFLRMLGLENVQQLPDFEKLSKDERIASLLSQQLQS